MIGLREMVAKVTPAPAVPTHQLPSKRQAEPCLLPRGLSGVGGGCLSHKLLPDVGSVGVVFLCAGRTAKGERGSSQSGWPVPVSDPWGSA